MPKYVRILSYLRIRNRILAWIPQISHFLHHLRTELCAPELEICRTFTFKRSEFLEFNVKIRGSKCTAWIVPTHQSFLTLINLFYIQPYSLDSISSSIAILLTLIAIFFGSFQDYIRLSYYSSALFPISLELASDISSPVSELTNATWTFSAGSPLNTPYIPPM